MLQAVVHSYITNHEPVGSRYLTKKYAFNISAATIRNIMADLEEMGFLMQPHTSAGRVPTDKGYRFYVDTLKVEDCTLDPEVLRVLKDRFASIWHDVNKLIQEATQAASELSHTMVFAVPVRPDGTTLNRVQFYRYRNSQTVVIIMTDEGLVTNRIMNKDFGLSQKELNDISDYLNAEYSGYTIDQIRASLQKQVQKARRRADALVTKAVEICRETLAFTNNELIVSGMTELFGLPEFSDQISMIKDTLEDRSKILSLLDSLSDTRGVKVLIGSENPFKDMRNMSLVTADYGHGDRPLGYVGMIGSTSMDYSRAIPMIDIMARFISATLSK